MSEPVHELRRLGELYGVQTAYHDGLGQWREASEPSLLAVLSSLGAPVSSAADAGHALRERHRALWQRAIEPVVVVWDAGSLQLAVRVPSGRRSERYRLRLQLEDGGERREEGSLEGLSVTRTEHVDGDDFAELALHTGLSVPLGYHRVVLEMGAEAHCARVIGAPRAVWGQHVDPTWGLFMPTYALRSERSSGAGDFTDLESLARWVGQMGGGVVGTLPMLAAFLDEPFDPSPYAPVSRLFWNELFVDPSRLPELERCPEARELLASEGHAQRVQELGAGELVDYRAAMALKRPVLEALAHCAFGGSGRAPLEAFAREHARLADYAAFRAVTERRGEPWRQWPVRLREGDVQPEDCDEDAFRYHLYVQWRAGEQLAQVAERAREHGPGLYLDLPLGVHPDGYDAWRYGARLLEGTSAGAPPDDFFTLGQSWGFAPFDPEAIRHDGYDYVAACLRSQMRHAGVLRIDHVMWLHRIFCVPDGMSAQDGVYVRYRPDELYAVLSLESHRNECMVLGEDLGTVPPEVREAMAEHGVLRMYVLQFEMRPDDDPPLNPVPAASVASVNTHDMPPFTSFWHARDVDDRIQMGLMDESQADSERGHRAHLRESLGRFLGCHPDDAAAVLRAALGQLAGSEARVVLANLEDLWLEPLPQNVPGTGPERPNWRRRARHTLEQARQMPSVVEALRELARKRQGDT